MTKPQAADYGLLVTSAYRVHVGFYHKDDGDTKKGCAAVSVYKIDGRDGGYDGGNEGSEYDHPLKTGTVSNDPEFELPF